ncbi:hypothetical protein B0H14DRAFT_2695213 [Mycena olivaceomarginata]|nr:hypothetical protein B0H14DRAFT_2695213 [Mycena olivaceomarginata]
MTWCLSSLFYLASTPRVSSMGRGQAHRPSTSEVLLDRASPLRRVSTGFGGVSGIYPWDAVRRRARLQALEGQVPFFDVRERGAIRLF